MPKCGMMRKPFTVSAWTSVRKHLLTTSTVGSGSPWRRSPRGHLGSSVWCSGDSRTVLLPQVLPRPWLPGSFLVPLSYTHSLLPVLLGQSWPFSSLPSGPPLTGKANPKVANSRRCLCQELCCCRAPIRYPVLTAPRAALLRSRGPWKAGVLPGCRPVPVQLSRPWSLLPGAGCCASSPPRGGCCSLLSRLREVARLPLRSGTPAPAGAAACV